LKAIGSKYVVDVDEFAKIFEQELKNTVNEMSLQDIERNEETRIKFHNKYSSIQN
jgi:hypothetical protein